MKTFWLSFIDPDLPTGQRFLGVAIVDVTEEDEAAALEDFPQMHDRVRGPGVIAAARKAAALGCNPGGEVAAHIIPPGGLPVEDHHKNLLLDVATLQEFGLIERVH